MYRRYIIILNYLCSENIFRILLWDVVQCHYFITSWKLILVSSKLCLWIVSFELKSNFFYFAWKIDFYLFLFIFISFLMRACSSFPFCRVRHNNFSFNKWLVDKEPAMIHVVRSSKKLFPAIVVYQYNKITENNSIV